MWRKNLLFAAVCLVGLAALARSVVAPRAKLPTELSTDGDSVAAAARRIDAAFERGWREKNVTPAAPADQLTIARRLSLALVGSIPSLEDIRRFESLPPETGLDLYLAELLADRRYADYTAERLARAFVGVEDGPFLLYRRRRFVAWLADQLAESQPYDQIVRHLISDSGLWTDVPATNFLTVTITPGDDNRPDPNRLAARVSRAFLGVRIDCAECHDHPFAAWKQQDFQGLAAFFGGTRQGLRGIHDVPGRFTVENRQTGEVSDVACRVPFQTALVPGEGTDRQRLAAWVTHRGNRPFAREAANRAWAQMFGRALVEPIDDLPLDGPFPETLQLLADDFVAQGYDWRRLLRVIAATRVFRLESRRESASVDETSADDDLPVAAPWATFPLTRLRPEQVVGAVLQSASLATIDYESNILVRFARAVGQSEFIERYGDAGADEFDDRGGTIPQRLLMMNGKIVSEKTADSLLGNAATRIAVLAPDDRAAIETSLLAVLTRRPTPAEAEHFAAGLAGTKGETRRQRLGDLYWTLLNSTEFSWNH